MTWVKERLREYRQQRRYLVRYRDKLQTDDPDQPDISTVSGMIADMNYAIEWMRTGRRPRSRRGVEIRDAYSRAILMDMDLLPVLQPEPDEPLRISEKRKRELVEILMRLSERERQCFLLHAVDGLSYAEIAAELGIKKATVQYYVERAKSKVAQGI